MASNSRYLKIENLRLRRQACKAIDGKGVAHQINRFGSVISLHFCEDPVVDFASSAKGNNDSFKTYFHGMLDQGVYLPPSAFESYFLNDAISYSDLAKTLEAVRAVF